MYDRAAILRFADQFAGLAPATVIELMKQHEAAAREAERDWEVTRDWKRQAHAQRESAMERAARHRLAVDFGTPHGWTLTTKDFGLRTLAEGKAHGGRHTMFGRYYDNPSAGDFHSQLDHHYHYRRHRKAAAIAAHLYDYPANKAECEQLANDYGLDFEVPDFPSWWNPGRTTLVVYVGPAARNDAH